MSLEKYRLKDVAADFGVAPKEISQIMEKFFEKPKSNTLVLSDEELNVIFDYMTLTNQISSLEEVFAVQPAPKAEEPKQEEPKAEKVENKVEKKEEKPAAQPKAATPKPQPKQEAPVKPQEPEPQEEDQAVEDTAYYQTRERVDSLMSGISELEHKVVTMRYGLDGKAPMTAAEVGQKLNLTVSEVVDLETAALTKMRQSKE